MLKSQDKFYLANGKRTVLIVDDEEINREILGLSLEDDYKLLYAEDGEAALQTIQANSENLSMVLLDLSMPKLSGREVLTRMQEDPVTAQIPVIVVTADQEAEIDCLHLGAVDFIPKPYPQPGVIQARVQRIIELSEDRQTILSTERDPLTGLYNKEYFYRYAEQFDQHHRNQDMDAIVLDVNRFHTLNERYGNAYADGVLRRIGQKLREVISARDGLACRRGADTFLIYCPHLEDCKSLLEDASVGLAGDDAAGDRVHLRMGVYAQADKDLDIERRFDRAKSAADTVRNSFTQAVAYYDKALHDRELYSAQLIEDFHTALQEGQFIVYFQPKFNVRPDIPLLSSSEALIRWQHPVMGMISPGIFVPLFEDNGLVRELDNFVWRETARQLRDWKDRLNYSVPVSVNVSRVDLYDPDLIPTLTGLLKEFDLTTKDMLLEVTESAYTQDSEQIIQTVNHLRNLGFKIEMDDFGTGYSSLNMVSSLPIDALKLDMMFIRNAFRETKDTRMLEVIIDIADYLSVPVIAEGVETEEQLYALKSMGCDIVQGYFFSRPVPAIEFERFLLERRSQGELVLPEKKVPVKEKEPENSYSPVSHALAAGYESIYYIDTDTDRCLEFVSQGKYQELQLQTSGADFFADCQASLLRVVSPPDQERVARALDKEALLSQLKQDAPFNLTYRLMISGVPTYYTLKAVRARTQEDHHIIIGVRNVDQATRDAISAAHRSAQELRDAQAAQQELSEQIGGLTYSGIAQALASDYFCIYYVDLETGAFREFSAQGSYLSLNIEKTGEDFFAASRKNIFRVIHPDDHAKFLRFFTRDNILRELEIHNVFSTTYRLMLEEAHIWVELKAAWVGPPERRHITVALRSIDPQIKQDISLSRELETIRQQARRDPLTGVKSLHAFQEAEEEMDRRLQLGDAMPFAVAVCDVNGLQRINDALGMEGGDEYLKTACRAICDIFKHSPVFRTGGDHFAVILQGQDFQNRDILAVNFTQLDRNNLNTGDPVVSFGIAALKPGEDTSFQQVFKRANKAMVENKKMWQEASPPPRDPSGNV